MPPLDGSSDPPSPDPGLNEGDTRSVVQLAWIRTIRQIRATPIRRFGERRRDCMGTSPEKKPSSLMPRAGWSCGGFRLLALPAGHSGLGVHAEGGMELRGLYASSLFPQVIPAWVFMPRAGWSCGGIRLLALPADHSGLGVHAEGGIRTRKGLLPGDFKSPVSACSTTPAIQHKSTLFRLSGSRRKNTNALAGYHSAA